MSNDPEKKAPETEAPVIAERPGGGTWTLEGMTRVTERNEKVVDEKKWNMRLVCYGVVIILVLVLAYAMLGRSDSAIDTCTWRFKSIESAMVQYYEDYKSFPPAVTTNRRGEVLHSWRTLLLPYLGSRDVYDMIRLDEPWNSDYNKQFHDKMPGAFACSGTREQHGHRTHVQYILGPETISPGSSSRSFADLKRDRDTTILFIEASPAVHWMQPADFQYKDIDKGIVSDPKQTGIGGTHGDKALALMLDGSVKVFDKKENTAAQIREMSHID